MSLFQGRNFSSCLYIALSAALLTSPLFGKDDIAAGSSDSSPSLSHVVALAPDVQWKNGNKIDHLSKLRGKPILILFTDSPKNHAFRHQLQEIRSHYEGLAAHGLICAVAFTQDEGPVPSNTPFITLLNGAVTAQAYGMDDHFGLALLGSDHNLDCASRRPLSGQRISDLMDASYTTQEALRRE